jgi:hypothetical protein
MSTRWVIRHSIEIFYGRYIEEHANIAYIFGRIIFELWWRGKLFFEIFINIGGYLFLMEGIQKSSKMKKFGIITFVTLPKNYNFRHIRVNIHIYCKSGNSISLK